MVINLSYVYSLMVTTKQKPMIDTQRINGKESKPTTTESYYTMKEESRKRKEHRGTTKQQKVYAYH